MISKKYKGRCEKITLSKCKTVCRTYNPVQLAYAKALDEKICYHLMRFPLVSCRYAQERRQRK